MILRKALTVILLAFTFNCFAQETATINIGDTSNLVISRFIYGQFAEHLGRGIYDGFWVDKSLAVEKQDRIRMDVVTALKKIKIPSIRWPGGCFADQYHWSDGIGPAGKRPLMVNTNWGGITEDNSFGTHEFLKLCSLIGCEPYFSANVGSGTVEEMARWIEYVNSNSNSTVAQLRRQNGHPEPYKVTFWGIGNESWGCGGNMTAQYYTDQFRRYASFAVNYPGAPLKKIASGPNADDYNWTETCMKNIPNSMMWGLSLHYYTIPTGNWDHKGSDTSFSESEYFNTMVNTLKMEELVSKHSAIMDKYDPAKKVALVVDEWGVWTDFVVGNTNGLLYQENCLRDALIAATNLNIFNNHCDRVKAAALAQAVNVLQSLILTKGTKMLLTPTYHVFDMYKVHQDAKYLPIQLISPAYGMNGKKIPAVNVSASQDSSGKVHISLVNLDPNNNITVSTGLADVKWTTITGQVLTSANLTDINTFGKPDKIHIETFTGAKKDGNSLVVNLPAKSVVMLELK